MLDPTNPIADLFKKRLSRAATPSRWVWPEDPTTDKQYTCTKALSLDVEFKNADQELALSLHARFGIDSIKHLERSWFRRTETSWTVEYGLSGGDLYLLLLNGTSPPDGRYTRKMDDAVPIEITQETGSETEDSAEVGAELSPEGPKLTAGIGGVEKQTTTSSVTAKTTRSRLVAIPDLNAECLTTWRLTSAIPNEHLEGDAPGKDPPLTTIQCHGVPITAFAVFSVYQSNFKIRDARIGSGKKRKKESAVLKKAVEKRLREFTESNDDQTFLAYALRSYHRFLPPAESLSAETSGP